MRNNCAGLSPEIYAVAADDSRHGSIVDIISRGCSDLEYISRRFWPNGKDGNCFDKSILLICVVLRLIYRNAPVFGYEIRRSRFSLTHASGQLFVPLRIAPNTYLKFLATVA